MRRTAWAWVAALFVLLIAGLMVGRGASLRASRDPTAGQESGQPGRQRPIPVVAVGHPQQTALPRTLQLTASITSLTQAVIYPKASGYLQVVTVRPGDSVRAGQVLAVIDHAQLDAQVAQAQASLVASQTSIQTAVANLSAARAQRENATAQVANARAGLQKAQAQLVDAQATYTRTAALVQQGAVAAQTLDDTKAQLVVAQTTVDSADAQVTQSQAQLQAAQQQEAAAASQVQTARAMEAMQAAVLENARIQLQYATIQAPFTGVVVSRQLDPGAYVTPGASTAILTIADPDRLDVVVNGGEADLPVIHRGDPVRILVDAYPGRAFTGVVSRIAGGVDPTTRTVQVEIDIPNPDHLLRPGMYATAQLSAGTQQALVVPLSALQTLGGQHYVWVVESGKVNEQPVTVGRATGEVVEINSGLTPDVTIVVRGADLVRAGQPVQTAPATEPGTP